DQLLSIQPRNEAFRRGSTNMSRRLIAVSFIVVVAAWVGASAEGVAGPRAKGHWRKNFAQAEAEARAADRPLLIHFHAKWCGPCKRIDDEVLNSAELHRAFAVQIVGVKVDIDQHPEIGRRFNIQAHPSDIVLSPTGAVLNRMEGYQAQAQYIATVSS